MSTTLRGRGSIQVEVAGARGQIGIDLLGTPANGQFLAKAEGGARAFAGASMLPSGAVLDAGGTRADIAPSQSAVSAAGQIASARPTEAALPFNMFAINDPGRTAQQLFSPADRGAHIGILHSGFGIALRPTGSGANGPGNADLGFSVSAIKTTDNTGEMDLVYLVGQQRGTRSDMAAVLVDLAHQGGTGFTANWEGVTKVVDPSTGAVTKAVRVQFGTIDNADGGSIGYYANAQAGTIQVGLLLNSNPGTFTDYITCVYGGSSYPTFNIDGQGVMTIRKGGLGDGGGVQEISEFYAATGGSGGGGQNTLVLFNEFYNYTTAGDWTTTAYRTRFNVDGNLARNVSPYYGFRGRPNQTAEIIFGFGSDGPALSIPPTGGMFLAPITADPTTPPAGSVWYNSATDKWNFRKAATTATL